VAAIRPSILITPGEPAGIGTDVLLKVAQQSWPTELVAICDPQLLISRAKLLDLPIQLTEFDFDNNPQAHQSGTLKIIPTLLNKPCAPGQPNPANAAYVLNCLELATDYCLNNPNAALVTGPINKSVINAAGIPFTGHTEFLAQRCQSPQVLMLFVTPTMKVALATTHIPLSQVSQAITQERLVNILQLLHTELQSRFGISQPKIAVCGLNPHAGEQGLLGSEEIKVIEPALQQLRAKGLQLIGPLPADTIFTEKYLTTNNAILAMYHDQALPTVKYASFNQAVNITLGLPFLRTSVDHGTAFDIAGTGKADAGSMTAAIQLACTLAS
jgi:4-hydroxythreonine-4-phosphate dehydrogenase